MKTETNGWGDSMIATKYVHERIHDILLNSAFVEDMPYKLSEFMDELEHNYKVDTGEDL